MDCKKSGKLILALRKEKGKTQREVAEAIGISDKTVSKWERGFGCPDVSLLPLLSEILGVNIEQILSGELGEKEKENGNMKRMKFYVCPECGNILTSTGEGEIACCGRKLEALKPQKADKEHQITIEMVDGENYVTLDHEMTKEHYISFIACVSYNRMMMYKLYPEQEAEARFPRIPGGKWYAYCSRDGLIVE